MHTFEIKQREGAKGPLTGATTEFLMDGKKMEGVTRVTLDVEGHELARLTIHVVGKFQAGGRVGKFSTVKKISKKGKK